MFSGVGTRPRELTAIRSLPSSVQLVRNGTGARDAADAGIDKVTLNALTGSVVVNYDTDITGSGEILKILKENDYYDDTRVITNEEYIQSSVSRAGKTVSKALFGWAIGKAIEDTGFALLAALI